MQGRCATNTMARSINRTSGSDQFFFAFSAAHSFWVSSLNPWPLQEFWPLQELVVDLQADCPLQELTPAH